MNPVSLVLAAACLLSGCGDATPQGSATDVPSLVLPKLTRRVVDEANLLRPEQELDLATKSEVLEAQTGRQLVIVTVKSLQGQGAASFARTLDNSWGVGRKGHNDGTILLVAPNEREVRIASGDGLAKILPNSRANAILHRTILPRFREGDLAGGTIDGANALIGELSEERKLAPDAG